MTFSSFDYHSSQLFKSHEIIKFSDLVTLVIATFMFKFHNQLLPSVFQSFLDTVHSYNTRRSAKKSYYLPKARTNYRNLIFDFRALRYGMLLITDIALANFNIKS